LIGKLINNLLEFPGFLLNSDQNIAAKTTLLIIGFHVITKEKQLVLL